MTPFRVRAAQAEDLEGILTCWSRSFGDERALVLELIERGGLLAHAVAAEADGRVCGAFFCFDGLRFGKLRAGYLYALCVLQEYRSRGIGAALCRASARRCLERGADLAVLAPGDASLERWYRETLGLRVLCRSADVPLPAVDPSPAAGWERLGFEEYARLRAERGAEPAVPLSMLAAQDAIFRVTGGGFFRAGDALLCAEPRPDGSGGALVRELLCAPEARDAALGAAAVAFGGGPLYLRQTAPEGRALLYLARDGRPLSAEGGPPHLPFPLE